MFKAFKLKSTMTTMMTLRPLPFALAGLALLASCAAVGPDYTPPEAPVARAFTREPVNTALPQAVQGEVLPEWWKAYGSPRVDALVESALAHNPSIEAGLATLKAAQENVTAQRGLFYPMVSASYGVSRQNSGNVLSSPLYSGSSLFNLHTAQLTVGFVPDVLGGNRRQVESLQASALSQAYQLDAFKITLVSNVVAAAIQDQLLSEQIAVVKNAIQIAGDQLKQLVRLKNSGYSSGLDVAQQQATYAQTVALLPPLQKQIDQTRDLLAMLCGQLPAQVLPGGESDATRNEIHLPSSLPDTVPSSLVAHRPDVQAAQEQLHASYAQIGVAVANMLPQLSLSANLAYSNSILGGLFSPNNYAWGLLGGLTQPLFSGGMLSARKRAAEATAEAAKAQYQSVVLTAFQNVADTLYALDADAKSFTAAQDVETANTQLLVHTQQQFKLGYTSRLVLLTAQQAVLQAQLTRIASHAIYMGDTVALHQALGGGWSVNTATAAVSTATKMP